MSVEMVGDFFSLSASHSISVSPCADFVVMQLTSLALGLIGLYILRLTWQFFKLRRFAGPPWTGLSNVPHSRAMLHGDCHRWYADVNRKYGQ